MTTFGNLTVDDTMEASDYIGGAGKRTLDSGAYDMVVEMAYADVSKGGAQNINFTFKSQEGKTLKQTVYITSGTAKGGNNFYVNKRTGKKAYLPGFSVANDICLIGAGNQLIEVDTEMKTVKVWEGGKQVNAQREVIMDLLGKEVTLGVIETLEDKYNSKTGETINRNEIDKVFHTSTKRTVKEIKDGKTEADFYPEWVASKANKVVDKSSGKTATPAVPTPVAAEGAKKTDNIFL